MNGALGGTVELNIGADALGEALQALRDVPGVEGSFAVSDMGRLLARDMPAIFGAEVLAEVGPRALRLRDTLAYEADEMSHCMLRYSDYQLFLRPLRDGLLCVLTGHAVNAPAVRMAMTLAVRRLNSLLDVRPLAEAAREARSAGRV